MQHAQHSAASTTLCSLPRTTTLPRGGSSSALSAFELPTFELPKVELPTLELPDIFVEESDYANPIEPSHMGGGKLADAILQWAEKH